VRGDTGGFYEDSGIREQDKKGGAEREDWVYHKKRSRLRLLPRYRKGSLSGNMVKLALPSLSGEEEKYDFLSTGTVEVEAMPFL
jgi:hypothetical protein